MRNQPPDRGQKIEKMKTLLKAGTPMTHIAEQLGVSSATVYAWRKEMALELLPDLIADKIRRELICCNAYNDAAPLRRLRHGDPGWEQSHQQLKAIMQTHAACYWAGAAAEIVKSFKGRI